MWQSQHCIFFSGSDDRGEIQILQSGQTEKDAHIQDGVTGVGIDRREAFKRAYKGILKLFSVINKNLS